MQTPHLGGRGERWRARRQELGPLCPTGDSTQACATRALALAPPRGLAQPRVCGPRVSVSTPGGLVESAGPRAPSQTCGIRESGAGAQQPVLSQAPQALEPLTKEPPAPAEHRLHSDARRAPGDAPEGCTVCAEDLALIDGPLLMGATTRQT